MNRSLSYADAVRTLGSGESVIVEFLGRVSDIGFLTVGGINFVALSREFVRVGEKLLAGFREHLHGVDRTTRTERLRAAHTVIVLSAYFDALQEEARGLLPADAARLTAREQISAVGGRFPEMGWRDLVQALLCISIPWPAPPHSYEETVKEVEGFYRGLAESVEMNVSGQMPPGELSAADRDRLGALLRGPLPIRAASRYQELFRQLAADCPEFDVWVDLSGHQATRSELRAGLMGLEHLLTAVASGQLPDQRRAGLARAYRAALAKPIALAGQRTTRLRMPALGEGYVDHRFRVAEAATSSEPSRESWWEAVPDRDDVCRFLAGYLTSPRAWEAPLVVLGQPGSGKSVLMRILAARLPASDFLPVLVQMRLVPAEADLQSQIEHAIRFATGEHLPWPRLVESAAGALPVVLLDGFDELLQATGVTQTDFLFRVTAFQEREADQGRPLAVIVTSRTVVIDRAAFPAGTAVLRLEPFDDAQVSTWLRVWNELNAAPLAERGLRPLPVATALAHRELAGQPLLLLMLALYDADTNALQTISAGLGRTELYGRLLTEFARREVRKHTAALPDTDVDRAVENELLLLSVIAFGMFNRRSQWVSGADLDTDLSALPGTLSRASLPTGLRVPLTAAQLAVGRFFFIHESLATSDGRQLQTYEFLHATFGEFLVARLVVQILSGMLARETTDAALPFDNLPQDGLLHALLSFEVLTARAPVIGFLADLVEQMPVRQRETRTDLLLRLYSQALYPRTDAAYASYIPRRALLTARHAAWSANLVVLAVLSAGEITGSQLFGEEQDPVVAWRSQAMLWRAQLSYEERSGLFESIILTPTWEGGRCSFRLGIDGGTSAPAPVDAFWIHEIPPSHPGRAQDLIWTTHSSRSVRRRVRFTRIGTEEEMMHALEPLGSMPYVFVNLSGERTVSAANALVAAIVEPHRTPGQADAAYNTLAHVTRALAGSSSPEDYAVFLKTAVTVLISAVEKGAVSQNLLDPIAEVLTMRSTGHGTQVDISAHLSQLLAAASRRETPDHDR